LAVIFPEKHIISKGKSEKAAKSEQVKCQLADGPTILRLFYTIHLRSALT